MDRRPQHPNRDTLWWGRRRPHTGARSRTSGAGIAAFIGGGRPPHQSVTRLIAKEFNSAQAFGCSAPPRASSYPCPARRARSFLAADGQHPIGECYIEILLVNAWQLCRHVNRVLALGDVDLWR